MVFNKVVVSAFIKILPCLIDVGGLQPGMVKVVRKMRKTGWRRDFLLLLFHEMQM